MVSAVVDRGNGGPWEWRTPGMADLNLYNPSPRPKILSLATCLIDGINIHCQSNKGKQENRTGDIMVIFRAT